MYMKDIVVLLEDQLKPLVHAELSVLVDILHHPEYLFECGSEGRRKCESGGFISKWVCLYAVYCTGEYLTVKEDKSND